MYTSKLLCIAISLSVLILSIQCQDLNLSSCSRDAFSIPQILGVDLVSISAKPSYNFTAVSLTPGTNHGGSYTIDFCNVTVRYSHPGWNDTIHVHVWLPTLESWTGRLQALGGGGYSASFGAIYSTQAVARGDVAIDTDAGHTSGMDTAQSPRTWALTSPGNVNLYLLEDFGSRSLHEMALIGKSITRDFYGSLPRTSFFSGCSGGGRQGLMLAQRYPHDFDGILAAAPAINIETFIPAAFWAQQVMKNNQAYPPPCEVEAFTEAAVAHCDELDGVQDGIIARPGLCQFQAASMVGQTFLCNGSQKSFTTTGAQVVQAAWDGPRDPSGSVEWYGLNKDAALTTTYVTTQCASNESCSATSTDLLDDWFRYFLAKDPDFATSQMTDEQFFLYMSQSSTEYKSMLGAADPDLTQFRTNGGKMITWHGLADEVIPPNGTSSYHDQVRALDPNVDSFYRTFEAPGVGHCFGGPGHVPSAAFDQLVAWVEDGIAPVTLLATNLDGNVRELCPHPAEQVYVGGNITHKSSFRCVARQIPPASFAKQELKVN